jgi:hypothetical protein
MKKILFIAALLCACMASNAEKVTRTDDFKDGESKFGFDATADKKHSALLDGEYLVLSSKKGWFNYGTRFPVRAKENFKISYKLLFPKLDEDHVFGLVFNYDEDEDKGDILYITENKFYIFDKDGTKLGKAEKLKLKKGKDVPVNIDIEKKGKKLIISINGVDFINEDLEIKTSYMGFCVNEKNTLKVDKISITQVVED